MEEDRPVLPFHPALDGIANRAVIAGLETWTTRFKDPTTGRGVGPLGLRIDFPAGKKKRNLRVNEDNAVFLARSPFERWVLLGDYDAILDLENRQILAALKVGVSLHGGIANIPGAERLDVAELADIAADKTRPSFTHEPTRITLTCPSSPFAVELRTPQYGPLLSFNAHSWHTWALRISGIHLQDHDEALRLLTALSTSLFSISTLYRQSPPPTRQPRPPHHTSARPCLAGVGQTPTTRRHPHAR